MDTSTRAASEARWRRLLEEHSRSGLSLREFSVREGISANTLAYWKYKRPIGPSSPGRSNPGPQIVPVTIVDDAPDIGGVITLELGGARVTLARGFDREDVSRLITLLRRPC